MNQQFKLPPLPKHDAICDGPYHESDMENYGQLCRQEALEEVQKAFYATGCDVAGINWSDFVEKMK